MYKLFFTIFGLIAKAFDHIFNFWSSDKFHRISGGILVFTFLLTLGAIQLNIWGYIPEIISDIVPDKYFEAVELAFIILLIFEVLSLVFTFAKSFAKSLLKQFEIISLIMLRDAFKIFSEFDNIFAIENVQQETYVFLSQAGGAIFIFIGIYFIQKLQKHRKITKSRESELSFVLIKKVIAITLLLIFIFLGIQDIILYLNHAETFAFFKSFYTILIFADILLILISLRYNYSYIVLFRNSAFALVTLVLRISLSAPFFYNLILPAIAILFVLALTYFYNKFRERDLYDV